MTPEAFTIGELLRLADDVWRVMAIGTYHAKRGYFLHLESTTRSIALRTETVQVRAARFVRRDEINGATQ